MYYKKNKLLHLNSLMLCFISYRERVNLQTPPKTKTYFLLNSPQINITRPCFLENSKTRGPGELCFYSGSGAHFLRPPRQICPITKRLIRYLIDFAGISVHPHWANISVLCKTLRDIFISSVEY